MISDVYGYVPLGLVTCATPEPSPLLPLLASGLCLPALIYTGLSAPHPLEHFVFPFQLQRENKSSFSSFLLLHIVVIQQKGPKRSLVAFVQKWD